MMNRSSGSSVRPNAKRCSTNLRPCRSMVPMAETPQFSVERLSDWLADLLACLRFCTRVPIARFGFEKAPQEASIAASLYMLPFAGALIGAVAALVLWIVVELGLPASLAALLAVTSLIVLTGALHEDGLADFADGLGGSTQEQRLAIMKDSRIGTFGGLALLICGLGRILSLAALVDQSLLLAALVLIAAAASSRSFAFLPLYLLTPAREDGLGAAARPARRDLAIAIAATCLIGLLPLFAGAGLARVLVALILSAGAALGVGAIARRTLEGQTGDVAGAAQQVAELSSYLVFAARL